MGIDRSLWRRHFSQNFTRKLPCPRCAKGVVSRGENAIVIEEPIHSRREHDDEGWDPYFIETRFTTTMTCDNRLCGEIVSVSGNGGYDQVQGFDEYGQPEGHDYEIWLRPRAMYPAPPLFRISQKFPKKVQSELRLAFQLYWTDLSSSTSRLRTSLERVLDDKDIPTMTKNAAGDNVRLSLSNRIDKFAAAFNDADNAESMSALRVVGNLGTHGDEVTDQEYFDLLDVYEDALVEIYEEKKTKLKAKKQALIALGKK